MITKQMKDQFIDLLCMQIFDHCDYKCPFNIAGRPFGTCSVDAPDEVFLELADKIPFCDIKEEKTRLRMARWISIMSAKAAVGKFIGEINEND